jgi:hypothetical protein
MIDRNAEDRAWKPSKAPPAVFKANMYEHNQQTQAPIDLVRNL